MGAQAGYIAVLREWFSRQQQQEGQQQQAETMEEEEDEEWIATDE